MKLFDSHAHLLDQRFDEDREALIQGLAESDVEMVMECASSEADFAPLVELLQRHDNLIGAVGVHPHCADQYTPATQEAIKKLVMGNDKIKAIGEIGLDYFYDTCEREVQRQTLKKQLLLAEELEVPVILHMREATKDMLDLLGERKMPMRGVLHCFSGSVETAKTVLDMGLMLGFGGSITFKNANKLLEVVKMVPLERMVVETDSPYLTPVPFRGKRNDPTMTRFVAAQISALKGIPIEEVVRQTNQNAKALFGIK